MRDIKFRFWDGRKMQKDYRYATIWNGLLVCEGDTIPLQFTGLKDRFGEDIFEGDIVRIENYNTEWKRQEPLFDWRKFSVEYVRYTWVLSNSSINTPLADYDTRTLEPWKIEIYGNIYENPDLLTKEKL